MIIMHTFDMIQSKEWQQYAVIGYLKNVLGPCSNYPAWR